eukprot:CAMPEP_0114623302 /NCGR_PEP_ID=MMETSP0168-20121206/10176_1 /TAXON_ID=95228 ORGANISM="Vannella sp., Strain DIVA3 517/6/12" /NCGR_SAMPLE_ID=MMETSP0168 /ASSEMBLY_ACC=CAM_ASM_000044 /LENGTH=119 /DNA_ID=CAMNT_0001834531 /DNA_START=154 /DNA_END=510 /DNA_ORIENTATION=+
MSRLGGGVLLLVAEILLELEEALELFVVEILEHFALWLLRKEPAAFSLAAPSLGLPRTASWCFLSTDISRSIASFDDVSFTVLVSVVGFDTSMFVSATPRSTATTVKTMLKLDLHILSA